jgi:Protein of unknown function (DUF3037)
MANIFKYAILMAIPDQRRGERVNVGIVVFLNDRIDVRFAELSKIRALAGGDWDAYASDVRRRLLEQFETSKKAEEVIRTSPRLDPVFQASDLAWLSINSVEEYEGRIKEILTSLVIRPKIEARPKSTRINTEISRHLKNFKVLANRDETIDAHRVVRDFYISKEEELIADFALKNGGMHITATLDLRKSHVRLDEAALKAITLDKAKQIYDSKVKRFSVYAVSEGVQQFKPHIELLKDYSDKAYNWQDESERTEFTMELQRAAFEFSGNPASFKIGR